MRLRKQENIVRSSTNANELWMLDKLKKAGLKFSRQTIWGKRVFDFWSHDLGIAIEVDGASHDAIYDQWRDEYNFRRSGIVVLRVKNRNEKDAACAIDKILKSISWKDRKAILKIDCPKKKDQKHLSMKDCPPFYLPLFMQGDISFVS